MSDKYKSDKCGVRSVEFSHLMVDIETLGTGPDAVVTQIGAVFFEANTGQIGDSFERDLSVAGQVERGRVICPDTMSWYQENDLKIAGLNGEGCLDAYTALSELGTWIASVVSIDVAKLQVWCKGPDFDFSILKHLSSSHQLDLPWRFYNQRDVRTVVALAKDAGGIFEKKEVKHSALADCRGQVDLLCGALGVLEGRLISAQQEGGSVHE